MYYYCYTYNNNNITVVSVPALARLVRPMPSHWQSPETSVCGREGERVGERKEETYIKKSKNTAAAETRPVLVQDNNNIIITHVARRFENSGPKE